MSSFPVRIPYYLITNVGTALNCETVGAYPRHMVLAEQIESSTPFRRHVEKLIANGRDVILDNGAHEGKLFDLEQYADLILALRPTTAVMPDLIGQLSAESLDLSLIFAQKLLLRDPDLTTRFMVAVQGRGADDVVRGYARAAEWCQPDRYTLGFGQSYLQFVESDREVHAEDARWRLVSEVLSKTSNRTVHYHLLGARWTPSAYFGYHHGDSIRGIDSVKPCRCALARRTFSEGLDNKSPDGRLSLISRAVADEETLWERVREFGQAYHLDVAFA